MVGHSDNCMKNILHTVVVMAFCVVTGYAADSSVQLFEDGFGAMRSGAIGSEVGAHLEYHYLPKVNTGGAWAISTFSFGAASVLRIEMARLATQAAKAVIVLSSRAPIESRRLGPMHEIGGQITHLCFAQSLEQTFRHQRK